MIRLRGVTRVYRSGEAEVRALDGVSLDVEPGEFVAITGPSGSGKSTLLNLIGCLDRPSEGKYFLAGEPVSDRSDDELSATRNSRLGFVFQTYHLIPNMTALRNVELPLLYAGVPAGERRRRAREALKRVGLEARQRHFPNQLSGGERQRVAIARALVNGPEVILADEPTGNLDSRAGREVMELLRRLNAEGATVLLVTHDPEVAAYARRWVRLLDGRVVQDERNAGDERGAGGEAGPDVKKIEPGVDGERSPTPWSRSAPVYLPELVRVAWESLRANRLRSALTMLGVIIGVAAVIAVVAVAQGGREVIVSELEGLGTNLLWVVPRGPGAEHGWEKADMLTGEDLEAIVAEAPAVKDLSPEVNVPATVKYRERVKKMRVTGTAAGYGEMRGVPVGRGRYFSQEEDRSRARVAVIGGELAEELFGVGDPLGQGVHVNGVRFTVVGVTERQKRGLLSGPESGESTLYVPYRTVYRKKEIPFLFLQAGSSGEVERAREEVAAVLRRRHGEGKFEVGTLDQALAAIRRVTGTLAAVIAGIAAIALLVGGIGIMNIMLVSVVERTREVGLRRALGATRRALLLQFLVESVVLAVAGGLVGILAGGAIVGLIASLSRIPSLLSPLSVALAFLFSAAVGILFGVYPAGRAAALDPVEALRHE